MAVDILLPGPADFAAWRDAARGLLAAGVAPEDVTWRVPGDAPGLFAGDVPPPRPDAPQPLVPRAFVALAESVIRHRDAERFALLYRVLWRLQHGERELMHLAADADIARLDGLAKAVRRDAHKMHAFVRFREVATEDGPRFVAWFEPDHFIEEAEAGFFVRRFARMAWSIVTPRIAVHWDGEALTFGPGGNRADLPAEDAKEDLWRTYYRSIFNPARLKPAAMRAEMPRRYWKNLPEAREIPDLIANAPSRAAAMVMRGASAPSPRRQRATHVAAESGGSTALLPMPEGGRVQALEELRAEVMADRDTPLAAHATQAVFGEGPLDPPLMLVGEQPGDEEDLHGRPFIGPAGRLLDEMLEEAGVSRPAVYVTNAVKHFKFTPTGRRRLHQSPNAGDIAHYRPFLIREIAIVRPRLILALGGSAVQALMNNPKLRVGVLRGQNLHMPEGPPLRVTVHPSYLLRLPDAVSKARERGRFLEDLRAAAAMAA